MQHDPSILVALQGMALRFIELYEDLREPLVRRQGSQGFMSVAEGAWS